MLSRPIDLVLFLFVGREAYTDRFLLVPQVCAAPGGCHAFKAYRPSSVFVCW